MYMRIQINRSVVMVVYILPQVEVKICPHAGHLHLPLLLAIFLLIYLLVGEELRFLDTVLSCGPAVN